MPTKYVTVAGVATHFHYLGPTTLPPEPPRWDRGRTFLFLHGAGGNAGSWRRQLQHLGSRHSGVALDHPGHGRSGSTEGLGSIQAYADFTAAFADRVQLPPAVVVGTCMGAAVGLCLAAAEPERAEALVLVAAGLPLRIAPATIENWREVTYGRAPQPFTTESFSPKTDFALMRELWMEQVKTDPRVRYTDLIACNDHELGAGLGKIRQPTLIVAGRDDTVVPLAAAEALAKAVPGARLVVLDDAGHCAATERADAFNAVLDEFVGGLPARSAAS
jgi:3-oxoadipate enol-lactonase